MLVFYRSKFERSLIFSYFKYLHVLRQQKTYLLLNNAFFRVGKAEKSFRNNLPIQKRHDKNVIIS